MDLFFGVADFDQFRFHRNANLTDRRLISFVQNNHRGIAIGGWRRCIGFNEPTCIRFDLNFEVDLVTCLSGGVVHPSADHRVDIFWTILVLEGLFRCCGFCFQYAVKWEARASRPIDTYLCGVIDGNDQRVRLNPVRKANGGGPNHSTVVLFSRIIRKFRGDDFEVLIGFERTRDFCTRKSIFEGEDGGFTRATGIF